MYYLGSKRNLLGEIFGFLNEKGAIQYNGHKFLDLFAGTTTVGQAAKRHGFTVVSNDLQYYSYVQGRAKIALNELPKVKGLEFIAVNDIHDAVTYLNKLDGVEGFVTRNYCRSGHNEFNRNYYSLENGMRCDAIRMKLDEWLENGNIDEDGFYLLLSALLDAIDKVANTTSAYNSFLKHIKAAARKPVILTLPAIYKSKWGDHIITHASAFDMLDYKMEVVYLDPPYNGMQYSSAYHVLETIALWDNPPLRGITGLRPDEDQKSPFSSKAGVYESFKTIIGKLQTKHILVSYSDEGLVPVNAIYDLLEERGEVDFKRMAYKRYKSESLNSRANVYEYLIYCKVK